MDNNIDATIDNEFEAMKSEIANEVMTELASKGIEIIANDYQPGKELLKIMDEYNSSLAKLNKQIDFNNETYKSEKAATENYMINLDIQELKQNTHNKLDNILAKQEKLQEQQIRDAIADPNYRAAKSELLNIVSLLANCKDIPTQQLMEIISPAINVSDTKTLELAHTLLQGNRAASYAIETAITGVNTALDNTDLKQAISSMQRYIQDGNDTVTYYMWLHHYTTK